MPGTATGPATAAVRCSWLGGTAYRKYTRRNVYVELRQRQVKSQKGLRPSFFQASTVKCQRLQIERACLPHARPWALPSHFRTEGLARSVVAQNYGESEGTEAKGSPGKEAAPGQQQRAPP